jgi:hypothetical protein
LRCHTPKTVCGACHWASVLYVKYNVGIRATNSTDPISVNVTSKGSVGLTLAATMYTYVLHKGCVRTNGCHAQGRCKMDMRFCCHNFVLHKGV